MDSYIPYLSHSPSQSPAAPGPLFHVVESHRESLIFSCYSCVLSSYHTHWYYIYYYRIVSCFWCFAFFPFHSLFFAVTLFRLMKLEVEMQLMDAGVVASQLFVV